MRLPNDSGQRLQPGYGEPEFRAETKETLPEVAGAVDLYAGLLYPIMGQLANAGRAAIQVGDFEFIQRLFEFVGGAVKREVL